VPVQDVLCGQNVATCFATTDRVLPNVVRTGTLPVIKVLAPDNPTSQDWTRAGAQLKI